MPVLVDANVLLDILTDDRDWAGWSATTLASLADTERMVINPVIFAEVSVQYSRIEDVDEALPMILERDALPYEAAFIAGKAFRTYRQRGGERRSPVPDFLIGAHALVAGYRLLTRDTRRYRTYFPRLTLVAPD